MSEDVTPTSASAGPSAASPEAVAAMQPSAPAKAGRSGWPTMVATLALLGVVAIALRLWLWPAPEASELRQVEAQLAQAQASLDRQLEEIEALRGRIDASQQVNQTLREQSLSLGSRVRLVEDGLQAIARGGQQGLDGLRYAEVDFLLSVAQERLSLHGDISGALRALDLADAQLRGISEAMATSLRQTLSIETELLRAAEAIDLPPLLAQLDALLAAAPELRAGDLGAEPADADTGGESPWYRRMAAGLNRYFSVRRVDAGQDARASIEMARAQYSMELSQARLLLLRSEYLLAQQNLLRAQALLDARFDASQDAVATSAERLRQMLALPLDRPLPAFGETQRELRRHLDQRESGLGGSAATVAADTASSADLPSANPIDAPTTLPIPAEAPLEDTATPRESAPAAPAGAADTPPSDTAVDSVEPAPTAPAEDATPAAPSDATEDGDTPPEQV